MSGTAAQQAFPPREVDYMMTIIEVLDCLWSKIDATIFNNIRTKVKPDSSNIIYFEYNKNTAFSSHGRCFLRNNKEIAA